MAERPRKSKIAARRLGDGEEFDTLIWAIVSYQRAVMDQRLKEAHLRAWLAMGEPELV